MKDVQLDEESQWFIEFVAKNIFFTLLKTSPSEIYWLHVRSMNNRWKP